MSYTWNRLNVCMNPNRYDIIEPKRGFRGTIETAERDGRWYVGYSLSGPISGRSAPVVSAQNSEIDSYDSEMDALSAKLTDLQRWLRTNGYTGPFLKIDTEPAPEIVQLELFPNTLRISTQ